MPLFYFLVLLEQTVWIPIVIGIIRFRYVKPTYIPLLLYLMARAFFELSANLISIYHIMEVNALPYNLLYLFEAILVTWQLANLKVFPKKGWFYFSLQILWIIAWLLDMFFISSVNEFSLVFHTTYSFILLFFTTSLIGRQAVDIKRSIFRNTDFWFGVSFSIWFIYNVFYAVAIYLVPQVKNLFSISLKIITFLEISEAVFYLVLAWAIACIPSKRNVDATQPVV